MTATALWPRCFLFVSTMYGSMEMWPSDAELQLTSRWPLLKSATIHTSRVQPSFSPDRWTGGARDANTSASTLPDNREEIKNGNARHLFLENGFFFSHPNVCQAVFIHLIWHLSNEKRTQHKWIGLVWYKSFSVHSLKYWPPFPFRKPFLRVSR